MTEHEAASLFYQLAEISNNQLLGYISLLSAFLVMSYFAATKISRALMIIVVTLFSFVCLLLITQMNLLRGDMETLYVYILDLKGSGLSGLSWFGESSPFFVANIDTIMNLVTLGGFIGCLGFFFYTRNRRDVQTALNNQIN